MVLAPSDPITIAVIGAGQRGKNYSKYASLHPELCKVIAVAEPRPRTREIFSKTHAIPSSSVYTTWQDLHAASAKSIQETGKRIADAVLVTVQDKMHVEVVTAFAEQGYHMLCEKPMATDPVECIKMADAVKKSGKIFAMGHVLRYSPYNKAVWSVIQSGVLGKPINIVQVEPVGYFHFAHSYVRGNWSKEKDSSFSLLTKSCHDIDIILHYLTPTMPTRVSSFGSLSHFRKEAKPEKAGAAKKCLECPYESECAYSAKKIYLDPVSKGNIGWPASILTDGPPDIESITEVLKDGPYGKCVYESENDVVDHQVVNLEFADGQTVSFTMVAFTEAICFRALRIHFTHGELIGDMNTFTTTNFTTNETTHHAPEVLEPSGHGGGDIGLIATFIKAVKEGRQDILGTDVDEVLKSHLTVFASEASRREGRVVNVEEYERDIRAQMA